MDTTDREDASRQTRSADKEGLRRRMRATRAVMNPRQRTVASSAIRKRLMDVLMELSVVHPLSRVAVYLANGDEANIDAVAEALMRRGVLVAAPRGTLVHGAPFYFLRSLHEGLHIGGFGVREPLEYEGGVACEVTDVQIILTPGLAFDRTGGRLGFGGGWYDRVLHVAHQVHDAGSAPVAIGVCFDCQIVEEVPHEEHDQRVSMVVTETQTIDVEGRLTLKLKR